MSVLNTSKLTFFQDGGEPLKSGYIYVGQPNTDPQVTSNQKTVTLTDSQGNEFTAAQPLRTNSDGQISYNGKAITATVDGDYSLLILNSNQVQINGGWTPNVADDSGSVADTSDLRIYYATLADLKQADVSVGQTVGNLGNETTGDGYWADWLVISNSGETADDIDLIDFDNGLQGRVLESKSTLDEDYLSSNDPEGVRDNIDVYSTSDTYTQSEVDDLVDDAKLSSGLTFSSGSDITFMYSPDEVVSDSTSLSIAKYWFSIGSGSISYSFQMKSSQSGRGALVRVYRNSTLITEHEEGTDVYATKTGTVTGLSYGDIVSFRVGDDGGLANSGYIQELYVTVAK